MAGNPLRLFCKGFQIPVVYQDEIKEGTQQHAGCAEEGAEDMKKSLPSISVVEMGLGDCEDAGQLGEVKGLHLAIWLPLAHHVDSLYILH